MYSAMTTTQLNTVQVVVIKSYALNLGNISFHYLKNEAININLVALMVM